jgi:hypothetical protein
MTIFMITTTTRYASVVANGCITILIALNLELGAIAISNAGAESVVRRG